MSSVLIVDDEDAIRNMLKQILSREAYTVLEASSAEAALDILQAAPVSVMLCDRNLPGRDGDWLVTQVRERFPAMAIILATGDMAVPPRVSLQSGVVGYLVKPFTAAAVRDAVSDAMAWHRVAARNRSPD